MSILNAWHLGDRVVLASDSAVTPHVEIPPAVLGLDGPSLLPIRAAKLVLLPHVSAVLGVRGMVGFAQILLTRCGVTPLDFDGLCGVLPRFVGEATDAFAAQLRATREPTAKAYEQEVVIAGWSARRDAMRVAYVFREPGARVEMYDLDDAMPELLLPSEDDFPPLDGEPTPAAVAALMGRQKARFERPGVAIGGRLAVATLTRDAISVDTSHQLA